MEKYNNYIKLYKLDNSIHLNIIRTNFNTTIKLNFYLLKSKLHELFYCQNSLDLIDADYNKTLHLKRIGDSVYFTFFTGKNKDYNGDYLCFVLNYKELRTFYLSNNESTILKDCSNNNYGTGKIIITESAINIIKNVKKNKLIFRQFKKAIMNLNYNYSYDVKLFSDFDKYSFYFNKFVPGTNKYSYNGGLILSSYNNKQGYKQFTYSIHT